MPNTMRWRYGETNPVMLPVPVGYVIEIGDLLFLEDGFAKPASTQPDLGTLAANQEAFHDNFVGVAMQCTTGASAETIRIATSGVFEFLCVSSSFELGELIGSTEEGTGQQLESQVVIGVAAENLALGRCVKQAASPTGKVLVDIASTVIHGGPQAAA